MNQTDSYNISHCSQKQLETASCCDCLLTGAWSGWSWSR